MKPVINLDDIELAGLEHGPFAAKWAPVGERIGAKLLGYSVTSIPPGKKAVPFHNHRNNEEMFLVLDGEGTLRFGDERYPLRKHDIIACPPGGREVAHQIINSGTRDLVFLALSTMEPVDIWEYPDSNKVGANVYGVDRKPLLRHFFRAESGVDYFDREDR
ncbi:MAG TPA: cupin domain-containing protein [Polyangia bacterium]|jgi:uncharacterized cupin superfamily protein|nr:cupin domain-containing protein [Polyangia bacterium]